MPVTMKGAPLSPMTSSGGLRPGFSRSSSNSSGGFRNRGYGAYRGSKGQQQNQNFARTPRGLDEVEAAKLVYVEALSSLRPGALRCHRLCFEMRYWQWMHGIRTHCLMKAQLAAMGAHHVELQGAAPVEDVLHTRTLPLGAPPLRATYDGAAWPPQERASLREAVARNASAAWLPAHELRFGSFEILRARVRQPAPTVLAEAVGLAVATAVRFATAAGFATATAGAGARGLCPALDSSRLHAPDSASWSSSKSLISSLSGSAVNGSSPSCSKSLISSSSGLPAEAMGARAALGAAAPIAAAPIGASGRPATMRWRVPCLTRSQQPVAREREKTTEPGRVQRKCVGH